MTPQALLDAGLDLPQLQDILYADVDGYGLSTKGRERIANFGEDFTYGEVTPQVMWDMLHTANAQPGEVFYDLGSGTGKGVLFAGLLFDFVKCTGIEYLKELNDSAEMALARYQGYVLPLLPAHKSAPEMSFICGDMREQDISDADIVFTHCTCFSPTLMEGLRTKVDGLKSGARVITISRELGSPNYVYQGMLPVQMAWGSATAYMYQRN